ncbi:MAG: copper resistance protein CopC [Lachnospiraceae bacterium]|nr:copper resistance protein CopC [Lachnospiraceae bacterium]
MRIKMKRFLGILLSLTLMLGLLPGMSLTAYADTEADGENNTIDSDRSDDYIYIYEASLIINQGVTFTCNNAYSFYIDENGKVELYGSLTGNVNGSSWLSGVINVYLADGAKYTVTGLNPPNTESLRYYGYDASTDGNGTVSVKNGSTDVTDTSMGYKTTIYTFTATPASGYRFKNWTKGEGGELLGTDDSINVTCEENGQYQVYANFEEAPAHTHSFTYTASGATITATCNGAGTCDITDGLTLTISAPTGNLVYDGTTTYPATLSTGYNTTAFPGTYSISYTKDGSAYSGVPKDAGTYTASVTAGTGDAAKTASVSYTVTKAAATVTKAPEAKTLTYNGSAQELVTAGTATGGEMQYALGDANGATQPYTTSIPTKTDAGTYYVWYKVAGDDNHSDTDVAYVAVTIKSVHTVTWKNWDGSVLLEEEVIQGETPEYNGETPVKPSDAQYDYTFAGWTPNVVPVTGVAEYTATFNEAAHQHTFGTGDPRWAWSFVDGKCYAKATYTCTCGEIEEVSATVDGVESDDHATITYTATDYYGKTDTRTYDASYTVTYKGSEDTCKYGDTWSKSEDSAYDWKVNGVLRASGTKEFFFPVIGDADVTTTASSLEEQNALISVLSAEGGTNKLTYVVSWSLPKGAKVKSTMIYRCRDDKAAITTADDLKAASNLRTYNMKMKVRNGQYTFTASGLTSGSSQTIIAEVVYTYNSETYTINTASGTEGPMHIGIGNA